MTRRISVAALAISAWSVLGSMMFVGCGGSATASGAARTAHARVSYDDLHPPLARSMGGDDDCSLRTVYFGYDDATLDPESRHGLARAARCIRSGGPQSIHLIGATDPRGTEEYNLALGERRARAVLDYLVALGVEERTITFSSVGEELARGEDDESWALDRHVETIEIVHRDIVGSFSAHDDRDELGAILDAPTF